MFSMLSMLQKEGNAAQESPFIANAVRTKHSAGSAQVPQGRNSTAGATAQCRGSTQTPQGRNSTAGATAQHRGSAQTPQGRNSTAGATAQRRGAHKFHKGETARQGRQLRKAGTRAAGSQKLRLWRSLFWKPMTKLSLSVARYAFICSSSLRISRASNHVPMIDMIISINTISPAINQNVKVVNTASIYFSSLILITALGLFFCVMLYFPLLCSLYPLPRLSFVNPAI